MGMTLAEFSHALRGDESVSRAVIERSVNARDLAIVEEPRKQASDWLKHYVAKDGVETSGAKVYAPMPVSGRAGYRKIVATELKRRDPALYERCRVPSPWRKIETPRGFLERVPETDPVVRVPVPYSSDAQWRTPTARWLISRADAQLAYERLGEQAKTFKTAVSEADALIDAALTPHITSGDWDGVVPLHFNDGFTITLRRLQFDQDVALDLVPRVYEQTGRALGSLLVEVPHALSSVRHVLVSRAAYLARNEGDSEPDEGD